MGQVRSPWRATTRLRAGRPPPLSRPQAPVPYLCPSRSLLRGHAIDPLCDGGQVGIGQLPISQRHDCTLIGGKFSTQLVVEEREGVVPRLDTEQVGIVGQDAFVIPVRVASDGSLTIEVPGEGPSNWYALSAADWIDPATGRDLTFLRDESGAVTGAEGSGVQLRRLP